MWDLDEREFTVKGNQSNSRGHLQISTEKKKAQSCMEHFYVFTLFNELFMTYSCFAALVTGR